MKKNRQTEILNIIQSMEIHTQEQLLEQLEARGVFCTQATISRDIKELHLVKGLNGQGGYRYATAAPRENPGLAGRLYTIFRESVTSFDQAQNIVVIKTMPGLASGACAALDGMEIANLVGTLAGDDTAILIMRDTASASGFCEWIGETLS